MMGRYIPIDNLKHDGVYMMLDGQLHEACVEYGELTAHYPEPVKTVDAVPVVHGEWILEREPNGKPYCFHCSVCDGDFHYIGVTVAYDFCPSCTADMRKAAE